MPVRLVTVKTNELHVCMVETSRDLRSPLSNSVVALNRIAKSKAKATPIIVVKDSSVPKISVLLAEGASTRNETQTKTPASETMETCPKNTRN